MIERGEFAHGVGMWNDAFAIFRRTGRGIPYPEFPSALATGLAGLGQLNVALAAVDEGLDDAVHDEHGHDLYAFAELPQIKGEIPRRRWHVTAAENSFRHAIKTSWKQEMLF